MPTIEDELRRVMETCSVAPPLATDLPGRIRRGVARRRRARGLWVAATVLITVAGATGGIIATNRPNAVVAPGRPVPTASPTAGPSWADGALPVDLRGYRLALVRNIAYPEQSTVELTFTPTSWDFHLGIACRGPGTVSITASLNGIPGHRAVQCSPAVLAEIVGPGNGETMQEFWQGWGVQLGQPVTLTARLGTWPPSGPTATRQPPDTAEAVLGVYLPSSGP